MAPRFLRRVKKKLRRAQRALSHKDDGEPEPGQGQDLGPPALTRWRTTRGAVRSPALHGANPQETKADDVEDQAVKGTRPYPHRQFGGPRSAMGRFRTHTGIQGGSTAGAASTASAWFESDEARRARPRRRSGTWLDRLAAHHVPAEGQYCCTRPTTAPRAGGSPKYANTIGAQTIVVGAPSHGGPPAKMDGGASREAAGGHPQQRPDRQPGRARDASVRSADRSADAELLRG